MSEFRRRLRLLLRRFNLFDDSRKDEAPQGNVSGPPVPQDIGAPRP